MMESKLREGKKGWEDGTRSRSDRRLSKRWGRMRLTRRRPRVYEEVLKGSGCCRSERGGLTRARWSWERGAEGARAAGSSSGDFIDVDGFRPTFPCTVGEVSLAKVF